MKRKVWLSVSMAMVAAAMMAVPGCGSDGDSKGGSGSSGGGKRAAKAKCQDFLEAVCDQEIACGAADEDQFDDCLEVFGEQLDCDAVSEVSSDYDDCIDDIESEDECIDELPSSCESVFG